MIAEQNSNSIFLHHRITWNGEREILVAEKGSYDEFRSKTALVELETSFNGKI